MKFRRTMKAQSPKNKEKERNNKEKRRGSQARPEDMQQGSRARPEDMQQGSRPGQRICNKKNQHQGLTYSNKKAIKNPVKSSERTGLGYPKAARGSGSSRHAIQLKWD